MSSAFGFGPGRFFAMLPLWGAPSRIARAVTHVECWPEAALSEEEGTMPHKPQQPQPPKREKAVPIPERREQPVPYQRPDRPIPGPPLPVVPAPPAKPPKESLASERHP